MARIGRKPELSEAKKIELALERFRPMADGMPPRDYDEMAKAAQVSPKTVQRAVAEAFANRWVEIRARRPDYTRDEDLQDELLKKFANKGKLETVIVVRHDDRGPDFAHECLGSALADEIIRRKLFRDRDRIALGTGRAVHFVAESLLGQPLQLRLREGLHLVSLTGRIFPKKDDEPTAGNAKPNYSDNLADADTNISMMARVFDRAIELHPVMHPIAHDPARRKILLATSELEDNQFKAHIPNHAIVGFGVLDGNHRLYREVTNPKRYEYTPTGGLTPDLGRVKRDVEALVNLSAKYKAATGFEFPVGDVCNRFLLINRKYSADDGTIEAIAQKLHDHVVSLKECLITATKTQLGLIPNLMVIGAGHEKAHILHFLLSGTTPARPHIVVTDAQCAQAVLAMEDDIYSTM